MRAVSEIKAIVHRGKNQWAHAFGKAILLGEHAVVYGVPAIAVGIGQGASARTIARQPGDEQPSILRLEGIPDELRADDEEHDLARAFRAVLEESDMATPVTVEARTDLPPGGGLGCSAALGVAIARALAPEARTDVIAIRAMAWEHVYHGNPSGVDTAVSASGGCILFQRGRGFERLHAVPLLLCIGHSGTSSSTKTMVEAVAQARGRKPSVFESSFEGIRWLVAKAREALESGDMGELGQLMNHNQTLLSELSISTPNIDRMCILARRAGALGAKLTGAGGGGCVLALVQSREAAEYVLKSWKREGFQGFVTESDGYEPAVHSTPAEPACGAMP